MSDESVEEELADLRGTIKQMDRRINLLEDDIRALRKELVEHKYGRDHG